MSAQDKKRSSYLETAYLCSMTNVCVCGIIGHAFHFVGGARETPEKLEERVCVCPPLFSSKTRGCAVLSGIYVHSFSKVDSAHVIVCVCE